MKYPSQLVFAPLPTTSVIQHTVQYEPRSEHGIEENASQPKVVLHRYKQDLIYARLVNKNTSLELRRYNLDSSDHANSSVTQDQQSPVICINYSTAITSDIVFVNGDQGLYCWIVSVDGQLIRHKFQVNELFATNNNLVMDEPSATTNLASIVRPIKSFMNNQLVSLSVTASGVATIAFDDGSLVHIQDLEQHNAPTAREGLDVIYKDDAICEYRIHQVSTSAPFVLLRRVGGMMGWNVSASMGTSSAQDYISALASGDHTTLGVLQDHQISIWKDISTGTNPKLIELPQFDDAHQRLMDTEEQDLTCQFPGSFDPPPLNNHHDQEPPLSNDNPIPDYLIRIPSCGSIAIIFVGAKDSPYFVIYDIGSNRFLRVVMVSYADHDQQPLQFTGSIKDNVLRLWVVWAKQEKQLVLSTVDVSIPSGNTNDLVTSPDWQQMLSCEYSTSSSVDIMLLGDKQLMMATLDTVSAARDLDPIDAAFLQHASIEDTGCEMVLSTLSSISDTLDTNVRERLETQLRSCFPQGSPEELYKQHGLKDVDINHTPALIKNDIGKLLSLMIPDDELLPAEQHIGTMIQALILSATSQIVTTRFNIAFSLLILLTHAVYGDGDTSLNELMLSTWELLRTLDALRWLESEGNDMRQVYPVALEKNSWDIGAAAYHRVATLAKPDMLIEIADMLAVQGDTERAIALTRLFLDNKQLTMAMGGKRGDTVRAVQCRGYLANKELDHAVQVLQHVTDPAIQIRLLDDLLDRAYTLANYDFICKRLQPLGISRVGDCIRQKAERQAKVDTNTAHDLSWWELGYSFYALGNHMEQAYACMRLHMEQTGNKDELLMEFFSGK
ncbi:hypothetical protein K492DRAFT_233920 [Lichtheimia hyalospora FSU 10163]|nr:hypothetical protein K492DRAFT_233920 [Lichtheimia hyalospora FSU 10163]